MRETTGEGQQVQTSLLGSALLTTAGSLMEERALKLDRPGTGNRAQLAAPADVYAAVDGHIMLQIVGAGMFRRCARLLGRDDWLTDERLVDDEARGRHGVELSAIVARWCGTRSVAECLEAFAAAGLPAAQVLSPRQVIAHPAIETGPFWTTTHSPPLIRVPLTLSEDASAELEPAPALGADTVKILAALGIDRGVIASLASAGVLQFQDVD
jgi:crotonobetainyl-CoA:carnitine CoA-transferase CaiB-like acyl-CoA transferase